MKLKLAAAVAVVIASVTGCASTSPNVYSQREAMRLAEVSEGQW